MLKTMPNKEHRYIVCPRYKHHPKKHVLVCRNCRWKKHCRAYQAYRQPELPFVFRRSA